MIIECERCHTKFNLDEGLLRETGSKVRCSICKYVFAAFPPSAEPEIEEISIEKLEEAEAVPAEETAEGEDLLSELDKALAEEIEKGIDQEEGRIEAISIEELSHLDSGVIKGPEEEKVDIDEAMDRAIRVEEEITSQKGLEREEEAREEERPPKPRPIIKKRRRSGLLITILLIILLLVGASAALIVFKPEYLPESFPFFKRPVSKEQAFDMGNKRLSFKNLKGSFVNSEKAGKLFVVIGLVTNDYPDKRSFIRVRSNILDSKGKAVKSKITYAGNQISDKELQSLSVEEINNRLMNRFGKNNMNVNIPPKSSINFMIIFSELPEDISEFTVEAISSSPAKK